MAARISAFQHQWFSTVMFLNESVVLLDVGKTNHSPIWITVAGISIACDKRKQNDSACLFSVFIQRFIFLEVSKMSTGDWTFI